MLAVILLTGAVGLPAHAATQTKPLTVTEPNQTVSDDFDVTIGDGRTQSVLNITANVASSRDDETTIRSKSIKGYFTTEGSQALGIKIEENHPGKVTLTNSVHVGVDAELNVVGKALDLNALRTSEFKSDLSLA